MDSRCYEDEIFFFFENNHTDDNILDMMIKSLPEDFFLLL